MTAPTTTLGRAPARKDPETCHEVHCDDDQALCGDDVSGMPWGLTGRISCPLCLLIGVCPLCRSVLPPSAGTP